MGTGRLLPRRGPTYDPPAQGDMFGHGRSRSILIELFAATVDSPRDSEWNECKNVGEMVIDGWGRGQ